MKNHYTTALFSLALLLPLALASKIVRRGVVDDFEKAANATENGFIDATKGVNNAGDACINASNVLGPNCEPLLAVGELMCAVVPHNDANCMDTCMGFIKEKTDIGVDELKAKLKAWIAQQKS